MMNMAKTPRAFYHIFIFAVILFLSIKGVQGQTSRIYNCANNRCKNGGSCLELELARGYKCMCLPSYTGEYCEENVDECTDTSRCREGEICTNLNPGIKCTCPYSLINGKCPLPCEPGENCSTSQPTNICSTKPCWNGGRCSPLGANYTCECIKGYQGLTCSEDIDECAIPGVPPCNKGECVNIMGSFKCICITGWTGNYCDIKINYCNHNLCGSHGHCQESNGAFVCICLRGYTGQYCDKAQPPELTTNLPTNPTSMLTSSLGSSSIKAFPSPTPLLTTRFVSFFESTTAYKLDSGNKILVFVVEVSFSQFVNKSNEFEKNVSRILNCPLVISAKFMWMQINWTKVEMKYNVMCTLTVDEAVAILNNTLMTNPTSLSLPITSISSEDAGSSTPAPTTSTMYIIVIVVLTISFVTIIAIVVTHKRKQIAKTWFPDGFSISGRRTLTDNCSSSSNIIDSSSFDNISQLSSHDEVFKKQWCTDIIGGQSHDGNLYISNLIGANTSEPNKFHVAPMACAQSQACESKNHNYVTNMMHTAAKTNNLEAIIYMIDSGMDTNLVDENGRTPLHCAIAAESIEVAKALLSSQCTNTNARSADGSTPLITAVKLSFDMSIIGDLIKLDADLNLADSTGRTVLHWAAAVSYLDAAIVILHHGGINKDAQDELGQTALHIAAKEGSFQVAHLLLHNGASPDINDLLDRLPRDLAVEKNDPEMSHLLLHYAACNPASNNNFYGYAPNPQPKINEPPKTKKSKLIDNCGLAVDPPQTILEKRKRKYRKPPTINSQVPARDSNLTAEEWGVHDYYSLNPMYRDVYNNGGHIAYQNGETSKKLPISPTHLQAVKNNIAFNYHNNCVQATAGNYQDYYHGIPANNCGNYQGDLYQLTPPTNSPPQKPLEKSPGNVSKCEYYLTPPRGDVYVTPPPESPLHSNFAASRQLHMPDKTFSFV